MLQKDIIANGVEEKEDKSFIYTLMLFIFPLEHGIAKTYRYFSENKVSPEMQYNIMVQVANKYKKKNLTK